MCVCKDRVEAVTCLRVNHTVTPLRSVVETKDKQAVRHRCKADTDTLRQLRVSLDTSHIMDPFPVQLTSIAPLAVVHTLGNLLTNVSLGSVAVSFTHTIKVRLWPGCISESAAISGRLRCVFLSHRATPHQQVSAHESGEEQGPAPM